MDTDRFDSLVRALFTTPSRRAVTRALVGLTAASFLAPLLRFTEAGAKGKKGKRRRKKRKKDKKKQQCGAGSSWCEAGTAGDLSECCSTKINPSEGEPYEICMPDCGCCDLGFSNCCPGRGVALCCANSDTCHHGPNFEPFCCPSGSQVCQFPSGGSRCCGANTKCCSGECCPLEGNKCCPGRTGCFFPEFDCSSI